MRKHLLWICGLLLLACGGVTITIAGSWGSQGTVPGSGWTFTFSQSGATVSGSGEEQIEAGAPRPFVLEGNLSGSHLSATLTFTDQNTQAGYEAEVNGDAMAGKLTQDGSSFELDLVRQP